MATRTLNYGSRTAAATVTNLNSLGSAAAKPLGRVDNSSSVKAIDYLWYLEMTLGASGVSATGTVDVYLIEDQVSGSGDATDGIDMAGTADIASSINNAMMLVSLAATANNQIVRFQFRLRDYIATVPNGHALVIKNNSGAAFAASGNDAQYVAIKEDIA